MMAVGAAAVLAVPRPAQATVEAQGALAFEQSIPLVAYFRFETDHHPTVDLDGTGSLMMAVSPEDDGSGGGLVVLGAPVTSQDAAPSSLEAASSRPVTLRIRSQARAGGPICICGISADDGTATPCRRVTATLR